MKFKLSLNQNAPSSNKRHQSSENTVRKELKKFKSSQKQQNYLENPNISQNRRELAKRLEDMAASSQCLEYNIDALDSLLEARSESFKHFNTCQAFVLRLLRTNRVDVISFYKLVIRYLVLLRSFSGDAPAYSKVLRTQIGFLDYTLQELVRDSYSAQFVFQAADEESDFISELFQKAFQALNVSAELDDTIDSWISTGILKQTQRRLDMSNERFKNWFFKGRGSSSPDASVNISESSGEARLQSNIHGDINLPPEEQPAAAMILAVQRKALEDARCSYANPGVVLYDSFHIKEAEISPQLYTQDLNTAVDKFYRALEWPGQIFYEKGATPPEEEWVYEGWTTGFYNHIQAQNTRLEQNLRKQNDN